LEVIVRTKLLQTFVLSVVVVGSAGCSATDANSLPEGDSGGSNMATGGSSSGSGGMSNAPITGTGNAGVPTGGKVRAGLPWAPARAELRRVAARLRAEECPLAEELALVVRQREEALRPVVQPRVERRRVATRQRAVAPRWVAARAPVEPQQPAVARPSLARRRLRVTQLRIARRINRELSAATPGPSGRAEAADV